MERCHVIEAKSWYKTNLTYPRRLNERDRIPPVFFGILWWSKTIAHVWLAKGNAPEKFPHRRSGVRALYMSGVLVCGHVVGTVVYGLPYGVGKYTQQNHLSSFQTSTHQHINHMGYVPRPYRSDIPCPRRLICSSSIQFSWTYFR